MKIFKYIFIIILFTSCTKDYNLVHDFYPNGNKKNKYYTDKKGLKQGEYIEFFKNGSVKIKSSYYNDTIVGPTYIYFENESNRIKTIKYHYDSIVKHLSYYKNNLLQSTGKTLNDSLKIGKWEFCDSLGLKCEAFEYLKINNQSYLNQHWEIDKKGDTIGGNYYKLKMKDTLKLNEPSRLYFLLSRGVLSENSLSFICLPKEGYKLKQDFSNYNQIKWDTIKNVFLQRKKQEKYKDWNHDIIFDLLPTNKGNKNLRGILLEKDIATKDTLDFITRKIYFDIPYYVAE